MNGDNFLPLIRRWVLLLIAAAVASGAVGYFAAGRISPTYEARARLLVGPLNTDIDTLRASGQLTRTYAELATGEQVLGKAAAVLGPEVKVEALRRSVEANANDVTRLLTIRATSRDPVLAARTAEAVAQEVVRLTSSPEAAAPVQLPGSALPPGTAPPVATVPPAGAVSSVDAPQVPDHPIAPNIRVHVLLSVLAGVLMALAMAFAIESFGRNRTPKMRAPSPMPVVAGAHHGVADSHPSLPRARSRIEG